MKVAAVQHDIEWEDGDRTRRHLDPLVDEAVERGAGLVVVTEMYATGFSMAPERIAEAPDGPSVTYLAETARRHGVWVCGSVAVHDPSSPKPVNRLVLAGPRGDRHHYDKLHPFTYGGEHEHYGAGDRTLTVDVAGLRCSFFVCYDLRFGDDWWDLAEATDCYVVVANWPEARRVHWQVLAQARAIENQAYVVAVNRVGEGGGLRYAGESRIFDPLGQVLAEGGEGEAVLVADVDASEVARVRARFPFLRDRRPSVATGTGRGGGT